MANSDAGTSSGSAGGGKYQVFLNFHGKDTRDGFTNFLYQDLVENCIYGFIDDEELRVGEKIGEELLKAINNSQFYIPIFSKNYADSKWCLRELARIVENASKSEEKKILPIFYDVEPDVVDLKIPLYKKAIEKHKKEHKEKFPDEEESWEGKSWEKDLKTVDKIKGWELPKCKNKAVLMKLVVKEVLDRLKKKYKIVTEDLVGLDSRVEEVLKLFDAYCNDVRLLGFYGMGGIGKSTLARVIYNKLSNDFGKCCAFLDDIRGMSKKKGLVWLQRKLLTEIVDSKAAEIVNDVERGRERIEATLAGNKFLIVLDDVDEKEQIENLMGQDRLHPGTIIIITTRNKSVLKVKEGIMAHAMKEMDFEDALLLFKRRASLEGSLVEDFDSLSRDIVSTTGGLPLTLEVVGSLLSGKPKAKWENTLKQLIKIPHKDVQKTLMISYKDLNYRQHEIFLDIACFFINEDMTNANYMWEACGFYPNVEIDVLVEMSLITIKDNKFWMHDQLRDLGREIVCQESPTILGRRSRLWTSEEVLNLVGTKLRKKKVEAIDLWGSSHISIKNEEIERFESLRFLRLYNGSLHGDFTDCLPMLKWISWSSPLLDCSVANMHMKNLVVLEFYDNHFADDSKVWDSLKMATKLKSLALVKCHGLSRTPDLSKCLTLERLTCDDCGRLKEIDSSIGMLTCLLDLNIIRCLSVERVPDEIGRLVKLEHFFLKCSHKVHGLPTSIGNLASLRKLDLSMTGIRSLPDSIGKLSCLLDLHLGDSKIAEIPKALEGLVKLQCLDLQGTKISQLMDSIGKLKSLCILHFSFPQIGIDVTDAYPNSWELPKAIGMLDKLKELDLSGHKKLVGEIPNEIEHLSSLRVLRLFGTGISRVPRTINSLSHLSTLDLRLCEEITELPELPTSLVHLLVKSCSLQMVPNLSKLTNLVELELSDSSFITHSSNLKHKCDLRWIGMLSKLEKLHLCLLNMAVPPIELGLLSLLKDLTLLGLDLRSLEQLPPSLLSLVLDNFSSTGSPQSNLEIPSNLTFRYSRLQEIQLHGFSKLQHLRLSDCYLQSLSIQSSIRTLKVYQCPNMIEIRFLDLSASLEELTIHRCGSIGRIVLCGEGGSLGLLDQSESSSSGSTYCSPGVLLPNASKKLKRLELHLCGNLLEIQVIGPLLSLQDISIYSCDAMEKLNVSNLKNLHHLVINNCLELRVVEGLDELESLTKLDITYCHSLETLLDISNSKIPDECLIRVISCGGLAHHFI